METYSLKSWLTLRAVGHAKDLLREGAASISWFEGLKRPPLLVLKVVLGGAAKQLPSGPKFEQLDLLPPQVGHVLDLAENNVGRLTIVSAVEVAVKELPGLLVSVEPGGIVFVWPSFYGRDP